MTTKIKFAAPEDFTIITDPTHPLYCRRVERAPDKATVELFGQDMTDDGTCCVLSPVFVTKDMVLVAGRTRVRVSKKLGCSRVPYVVVSGDQARALMIRENEARSDTSPVVKGFYAAPEVQKLLDDGMTAKKACATVGKELFGLSGKAVEQYVRIARDGCPKLWDAIETAMRVQVVGRARDDNNVMTGPEQSKWVKVNLPVQDALTIIRKYPDHDDQARRVDAYLQSRARTKAQLYTTDGAAAPEHTKGAFLKALRLSISADPELADILAPMAKHVSPDAAKLAMWVLGEDLATLYDGETVSVIRHTFTALMAYTPKSAKAEAKADLAAKSAPVTLEDIVNAS
jgi:hypothetical protein